VSHKARNNATGYRRASPLLAALAISSWRKIYSGKMKYQISSR
jgi:hypothetical protein